MQDTLNETPGINFRHEAYRCFAVILKDLMTEDVLWIPGMKGIGDTRRNDITFEMCEKWRLPDQDYAYNHTDYHYWPDDKATGVGLRNLKRRLEEFRARASKGAQKGKQAPSDMEEKTE